MTIMAARDLADDLRAIVGERHVRVAVAERATYAMDGLPTHRRLPDVVVLPGTREEVIAVIRLLAVHGIPFVPRGAGTGLSGGALADDGAVLIVLTRLSRILKVDARNRSAVVEPGVVNARLSAATRPHGLHYAPDPSSQSACTIGGNVAENAGGPHCLKYGVTANHILSVEVVLASGETVILGSPSGEPWGPDLVGLFVGSEGNFGVATRISVRLTPLPRAVRTLLADFMALRTAGEGVSAIIASGIVPAALEMMDQSCIQAVEDSVYAAGYPRDAAAVLLVEIDGGNADAVIAETEMVTEILRKSGARSVRSAASEVERERLWQGRKKAFGAMGRLSRDLVVQDAVVPRSALPDVLETIAGIAARHRLVVSNVFHAGDGNLHPNISFDGTDEGMRARVEEASAEIMAACIAVGGTITGEHGVGLDKLRYMPLIFDAESLGAMLAVRRVFDPEERVNPGKVVPVHACREWSANPGRKPGVEPKPYPDASGDQGGLGGPGGLGDPRAGARGQLVS
jgi:glycolate oxidase subunit GlcD